MRLTSLATHIPETRIPAERIVRAAGGSRAEARVFERMFGLCAVACATPERPAQAQFAPVIESLAQAHDGALPDTLIVVRGMPQARPEAHLDRDALRTEFAFLAGIERLYRVDQNNCGGVFWALDMAHVLLGAGVAKSVLVLAGEDHSGLPLGDRYLPGCTLMGDAFCGLVLDLEPGGLTVGRPVLHTHPQFCFGHAGSVAQMGGFFAAHGTIVRDALDRIGFDWEGQGALLPHNVNRFAWESFARESGIALGRIRLGLLPDIGHCYTADPLLLLAAELAAAPVGDAPAGDAVDGRPFSLVSVGMGGFVGACRIQAVPATNASCPPTSRARIA